MSTLLPTTVINEIIVTGRKERRLINKESKLWQRISRWTHASDVEFPDGKTAVEKVAAIIKALANGRIEFIVNDDGSLGYKLDGADTVYPFNNVSKILYSGLSTNYNISMTGKAASGNVTSPLGYGSASGNINATSNPIYIKKMPNGKEGYITSIQLNYRLTLTGGGNCSKSISITLKSNTGSIIDSFPTEDFKSGSVNYTRTIDMFKYPVADVEYVTITMNGSLNSVGYIGDNGTEWISTCACTILSLTTNYLQKQ